MFKTSSFRPNTAATIKRQTDLDLRGRPVYGPAKKIKLSIVRLEESTQATSIRTDKSGTKSRAEELTIKSRFLMRRDDEPKRGDVVEVYGLKVTIEKVFPRIAQSGELSHYQVDGRAESS